jgi:hypothetical protein
MIPKASFLNPHSLNNGTFQFFKVQQFDWNKETKTFVQEASMLGIGSPAATIMLTNPETGKRKSFKLCGVNRNSDEIYGWKYKTNCGIKVLIIND